MVHVMVDLETLGLDPTSAPILQIGAAAFELNGDGPATGVPLFSANVNVASNLRHPFHRSIDPGTVAFWADTDPELLVELMRGKGEMLTTAEAIYGDDINENARPENFFDPNEDDGEAAPAQSDDA